MLNTSGRTARPAKAPRKSAKASQPVGCRYLAAQAERAAETAKWAGVLVARAR